MIAIMYIMRHHLYTALAKSKLTSRKMENANNFISTDAIKTFFDPSVDNSDRNTLVNESADRQTDTHKHWTDHITSSANAGGNKVIRIFRGVNLLLVSTLCCICV